MARGLLVYGINHHSAPVELRERLSVPEEALAQRLGELLEVPGVEEAVLLSTCNRVEMIACCVGDVSRGELLHKALLADSGVTPELAEPHAYQHTGREAVRHLFRVASSLDSLVVGEPQILGQMKDQYLLSHGHSSTGVVLNRLFHKSFSVAKRVRSETGIASKSVSLASVAVDLAGKIFESLEGRTALLLGLGEIGEVTARQLLSAGVERLLVANRTLETALELARELDGTALPLERMAGYLPLADLVIGCSGGGQLVMAAEVSAAVKERRHRPMFFIDLAVPRNFDPAINNVDGAYLYDLDDLASVANENKSSRRREATEGEVMVEQEVDSFWQWFEGLELVPTIVELRESVELIRTTELMRTLDKMSLDEESRERVDQMTRSMMNKLLHSPTSVLKEAGGSNEETGLLSATRRLFGLGDPEK
ncbi:MAG: glutamyl-tRNA reductase [Deltaproteobacteria bacterium]|nr:glutamyl-tRNA reductase [Deltaproteobacteria bacterium]